MRKKRPLTKAPAPNISYLSWAVQDAAFRLCSLDEVGWIEGTGVGNTGLGLGAARVAEGEGVLILILVLVGKWLGWAAVGTGDVGFALGAGWGIGVGFALGGRGSQNRGRGLTHDLLASAAVATATTDVATTKAFRSLLLATGRCGGNRGKEGRSRG